MGFSTWLNARRARWQPLPPSPIFAWLCCVLLVVFLALGVLDTVAWLRHGPGWHSAARGVLIAAAEILILLALLAQRTRFQLTARILTFSAFPLLAWLLYLRHIWAR